MDRHFNTAQIKLQRLDVIIWRENQENALAGSLLRLGSRISESVPNHKPHEQVKIQGYIAKHNSIKIRRGFLTSNMMHASRG